MRRILFLLTVLGLALGPGLAPPAHAAIQPGPVVAWGDTRFGQAPVPLGLGDVTAIAAGGIHSLALRRDGTVVGWGNHGYDQASVPEGLAGVTAISAGFEHSLALKSDGTVVAWGANQSGQASVPEGLTGVVAIAAGFQHSLALTRDGTVVGWGDNYYGEADAPAESGSLLVAVAAGEGHSLALRADGTVVAWGRNDYGQASVPEGLTGVTAIAAGYRHNLALKSDGTVVAWGADGWGQASVPEGLAGVVAIAAGEGHSLALKYDGTVVAWGSNSEFQAHVPHGLGNVIAIAAGGAHSLALRRVESTVVAWGDRTYGETLVPSGLGDATAIAAGGTHSLALRSDGTVVGWGGKGFEASPPEGLAGVTAISAGFEHSLALKADGTVVAWGANSWGQTSVPEGLAGVVAIAAGGYHSLALRADGTVVAWGNSLGATAVPLGLTDVVAIAAGGNHSLALKADGTMVAWGENDFYQGSVPDGLVDVVAISAGNGHNLALKADGTMVAWGENDFYQGSVPDGLTGIVAISAGGYHNLALRADGTVVAWGDGYYAQTWVPYGLADVLAISAGGMHSLALRRGDRTPPVITPTLTGALGANDWYTGDVTVTWTVFDPESAVTSQTGCDATTITEDTAGVTLTCTACSAGGTASQSVTVKRDATPPTILGAPDRAANANGWYNDDVTVSWTCDDALSGVDSCAAPVTLAEDGADQSITGTVTDLAGNTAGATVDGINVDRTPPTLSGVATTDPNANGWYNHDVTVSWTAEDGLSGIDPATMPAPSVITAEGRDLGAGPVVVADLAGNESAPASVGAINVDKTPPAGTILVPGDGAEYTLYAEILADWSASDLLSGLGVASATVGPGLPLDTSAIGFYDFAVTATDLAGNTATTPVTYDVCYDFSGLSPVRGEDLAAIPEVRSGSAAPLRFQLFDADGAPVQDAVIQLYLVPVVDGLPDLAGEIPATEKSGEDVYPDNIFRYDPLSEQYIFVLDTRDLAPGDWQLRIELGDGRSFTAVIAVR